MRYLLLIMLFFTGCAFKSLPPLTLYELSNDITPQSYKQSPYKQRVLKVAPPLSLDTPLDYKIYFKYDNKVSGSYQNAQWQEALYKQLQKFFIVTLQKAQIFKSVVSIESSVYEDLRLESTVYRLENEIKNNHSYAVLDIELRLINMKDRTIIKQKHFVYKELASSFDAKGYVEALNRALKNLANDMIRWIVQ